jgi:hypothetical protein
MVPNVGTRPVAALLVAALAAMPVVARAQVQNAGGPGEWLTQFQSARSLGLGGSFAALGDDALGIVWNPASIVGLDRDELRFENARLFEETSINGFGFAVPGSRLPSFGFSMLSLSSGDFQKTDEMNNPLGTFREGETAYLFTVAKGVTPRFALGANLKLVQQTVEAFNAGGFGVDLGTTFALLPNLRLALAGMNFGGPSLTLRTSQESYPTQIRAGAALTTLGGRGLVTAELDQQAGLGARLHAGAEYWVQPAFGLRVGYNDSYGCGGFSYRFAPQYQLDYAVADHALGLTHRVGLSWQFGGYFASSAANPTVFSPTGEHAVTQIALNAHTKADAREWTLEIVDKGNQVVRRFGGPGQPPSHIEWDGKGDTGLPLADGTYRYRLAVTDGAGRLLASHERTLEISTGGPRGEVPVVSTPDHN